MPEPRPPLSRGSSPSGYPAKPLVSFQINRQVSGWILPPLVIRAFGAHSQQATYAVQQKDPYSITSSASVSIDAFLTERRESPPPRLPSRRPRLLLDPDRERHGEGRAFTQSRLEANAAP